MDSPATATTLLPDFMQRANAYRLQKVRESMLPPPVQPGMPTFDAGPFGQLQRRLSVFNGTSGQRTDAFGNPIQQQQPQQPAWGQLPPRMEPQQQGGGGGGDGGRDGGRDDRKNSSGAVRFGSAGPAPQKDPFQALNDFQNAQPWKPGGVRWGTQADGSVAGIPDPGFSDDDPARAFKGGQFMPGQSAIVGDNPDGRPNKTQEMVTALPGGGFQVTPNPKTAAMMPHFAFGGEIDVPPMSDATARLTEQQRPDQGEIDPGMGDMIPGGDNMPPGMTRQTYTPQSAPSAPSANADYIAGLKTLGSTPTWADYGLALAHPFLHPLDTLGSALSDWNEGARKVGNAAGELYTGPEIRRANAQVQAPFWQNNGGTPSAPLFPPSKEPMGPFLPPPTPWAPDGSKDFSFGSSPGQTGTNADPWNLQGPEKPDSPELASAIANMKTLAAQTNARLGSNAVDPVLAEQQLRANPPQFMPGGPPVQSSNGGSFGQQLPTLSPGTATSPVRFSPAAQLGLTGPEAQAYDHINNPQTMAGRYAMLTGALGRMGIARQQSFEMGKLGFEQQGRLNDIRYREGSIDNRLASRQLFNKGNKKPAPVHFSPEEIAYHQANGGALTIDPNKGDSVHYPAPKDEKAEKPELPKPHNFASVDASTGLKKDDWRQWNPETKAWHPVTMSESLPAAPTKYVRGADGNMMIAR